MASLNTPVHGAGLGLRRTLLGPLSGHPEANLDFLEVAPENWLNIGGALGREFRRFTERYPFVCHGLSLSLGGPAPLDVGFIRDLRQFIARHGIALYSEHLSYCGDDGHLYDLMPIPFSEEAVHHIAGRIRQTQEILGQRIAVENVSYYTAPEGEMDELSFIQAVLAEADCDLLLDVNNTYVNGVNHRYDPAAFIKALPGERIAYIHVAGHYVEDEELIIDTHGAPVIDPVWELLDYTYASHGVKPTLLERDFNLPPLDELLGEVATIRHHQSRWSDNHVRLVQNG